MNQSQKTAASQPTTPFKRRPDGEIVLVAGASGSGKTVYTMRAVARSARLIVWDSHLEWSAKGCQEIGTIPELVQACRTREPAHLAYTGGPVSQKGFDVFCRVALLWGKLAPCTVVVEELADVSTPSKAPQGWGELLRWARKLGLSIYGITQRPAESDKTILGNAHRIVCHALGRVEDEIYMSRELRVEPCAVASLQRAKLEHIERLPDHSTRRAFTKRPNS